MGNLLIQLLEILRRLFLPTATPTTEPQPVEVKPTFPQATDIVESHEEEFTEIPEAVAVAPDPVPLPTKENPPQPPVPAPKKKFDWRNPTVRNDGWGSGRYNASRGKRPHHGIDIEIEPGTEILCPVDSVVTNHSVPYPTDKKWRGIQLTTADGREIKIFYCKPIKTLGTRVKQGDVIAIAQDIASKYNSREEDVEKKWLMKNHIHVELRENNVIKNPVSLWS